MSVGETVIALLIAILALSVWTGHRAAARQRERIFNLLYTIRIHLTGS